jgi:hypothetical protein
VSRCRLLFNLPLTTCRAAMSAYPYLTLHRTNASPAPPKATVPFAAITSSLPLPL